MGTSSLLALAFVLSLALSPAYATTYTMTLRTDASSYSGLQPILITGAISPVPSANTAVIITVKNQAGTVCDITEVIPSTVDGSFSYTSHPGGNAAWTTGTFTVNATWGGSGAVASSVVTFAYSPNANSTSSSSTSSSSNSSTSSSSSTASSTSSTTSSSSQSSSAVSSSSTTTSTSAPEFPSSAIAMVALVGVAMVAVFSRGLAHRPAGGVGR